MIKIHIENVSVISFFKEYERPKYFFSFSFFLSFFPSFFSLLIFSFLFFLFLFYFFSFLSNFLLLLFSSFFLSFLLPRSSVCLNHAGQCTIRYLKKQTTLPLLLLLLLLLLHNVPYVNNCSNHTLKLILK